MSTERAERLLKAIQEARRALNSGYNARALKILNEAEDADRDE